MIDPTQVTLICPSNDLESATILKIAKDKNKIGLNDVRKSEQGWGGKLGLENENLKNLKKNVIVIELPDPIKEKQLRELGYNVLAIDHHWYDFEDRSKSKSSLEQFAVLFRYKLNDMEQLIAANDRGHLWEMVKCPNVTLDLIRKIRLQDLAAQGNTDEDLQICLHEYRRMSVVINGCKIVFTDRDKNAAIADIHQTPCKGEFKRFKENGADNHLPVKDLLLVKLNKSNDKKVERLSFYGNSRIVNGLKELNSNLDNEFRSWAGTRENSGFWGIEHKKDVDITEIADKAISYIAGTDIPALMFSTMLLYSFRIDNEKCIDLKPGGFKSPQKFAEQQALKTKTILQNKKEFKEFRYFHDPVRRILLNDDGDGEQDSIKYYGWPMPTDGSKTLGQFSVRYLDTKGKYRKLTYDITHLAIHQFYNNICFLAMQIETSIEAYREFNEKEKQWEEIPKWRKANIHKPAEPSIWYSLYSQLKLKKKTLISSDVLRFNLLSRYINWEFPEQQTEGKLPLSVRINLHDGISIEHTFKESDLETAIAPSVSNIIIELIEHQFLKKGCQHYKALDNRMYVYSFMALAGSPPTSKKEKDHHEAIFTRFMYVDLPGQGLVYNPVFFRPIMNEQVYRRWEQYGTLYGITRYSSITLKYGCGFTEKLVEDYESVYYQMLLLALFYRCTLLRFLAKLSRATMDLGKRKRSSFEKLRKDFALFTNVYWFKELTNQDQGIELFNIYQKAFQYDEMYKQLNEDIDRASDLESIHKQKSENRRNSFIAIAAFILTAAAFLMGFFSLGFDVEPFNLWKKSEVIFNQVFWMVIGPVHFLLFFCF